MSNGFGAGFATLGLLLGLAGLAGLLGLTAAAGLVLDRRTGRIPGAVRYLAVGLLAAVLVVAGFGVLALADESAFGAGLLLVLVFVPLAGAVGRGWRADRGWLNTLVAASLAWSLPYLLGLGVFLAVTAGVIEAFQLAGGEARALGLHWFGAAGGAAVAVAGAVWLEARLARRLSRAGP